MTPFAALLATYAAASFVSFGFILMKSDPTPFRIVIGTVIVYGAIGSGLGYLVGYKLFSGEASSIASVVTGMVIGTHSLSMADIKTAIKRLLGL